MNSRFASLILAILLAGCAAATCAYFWGVGVSRRATVVLSLEAAQRLQRIEDSLEALQAKTEAMANRRAWVPSGEAEALPSEGLGEDRQSALLSRLAALERSMNELREAVGGLRLPSRKPTQDDFASTDGYLNADDCFAKGEYGQAAKGYETFLEHHGDHPEARRSLVKLREAYSRMEDSEKAIEVQEELIQRYPEQSGYEDFMILARMKRDLGRVEEAVAHTEQAIAKAPDLGALVGGQMTRAWFIEERDGLDAGLGAYREIEQDILKQGGTDSPFLEPCRKNISRIEEKVARRARGE